MSQISVITSLLFFVASQSAFPACTSSGEPVPWNRDLRSVCFENGIKRNVFVSPDKHKSVVADSGIGYHVIEANRFLNLPDQANDTFFPSEFGWSPRADEFFINNGNGSGLDGWTLQVFRLGNSVVTAEQDFNGLVVVAFRKALACSSSAVDPNVRGLGWSSDGSRLFAFAQSTVHKSCGGQSSFRGMVLNIKEGKIEHFYSESETRSVFRNLLPSNMQSMQKE
jgi:hypothetical protein